MKKTSLDVFSSRNKRRLNVLLIVMVLIYVFAVGFEVPFLIKNGLSSVSSQGSSTDSNGLSNSRTFTPESDEDFEKEEALIDAYDDVASVDRSERRINELPQSYLSTLNLSSGIVSMSNENGLLKSAMEALELGRKRWEELESSKGEIDSYQVLFSPNNSPSDDNAVKIQQCPNSMTITGDEFSKNGRMVILPCGLTLGSHITVVGKPMAAHKETETKISLLQAGESALVSQFFLELLGLKAVDGEDPPRILHFNPRLSGDWSGKPVIEQNTRFRMQWGTSQRCQGWKSRADEETVDGLLKCDQWSGENENGSSKSKKAWWLNRLIGRTQSAEIDWPFPFVEDKLFVLTLSAGYEGYHFHVDGRHITSFPYRTGFSLDDATGLTLTGDVDIQSIIAASLPSSHTSFMPQKHLDFLNELKSPLLPDKPVELFIGILSAANHFPERMAMRKSWMQHELIKSSKVVTRFFAALNTRKDVNHELKKEAEFFGDIVIVPYVDNYDLVVLKTLAICEYGARSASAGYIMKGDDDTFVRVDEILSEAKKAPHNTSLYLGNINYRHKPLRSGKWAVTHEEWPEEDYPPYANGPGYVISLDIANSILSDFEKHKLRLFKMEDVSMGMWVEKYNTSRQVKYVHSLKFCQYGCVEDYYTAHYQSPKQMSCLWHKLKLRQKPMCCSMR